MITPEQTQVNTQELIKKLNSGCYISKFDRDNIVKDMLKLEETVYNQQQEIISLKTDAERYRWLRVQDNDDFCFAIAKNPHFDCYEATELDAAIDYELKGTK